MGIDDHVRLLGSLLIIMGIAGCVCALVAMGVFGSPLALLADATQAGSSESFEVPLIQIYGSLLMIVCLLLAVPCVFAGMGLRKFEPWARDVAMVVSALLLAVFPVGTMLAIYSFWVILSPEIEPLFTRRSRN